MIQTNITNGFCIRVVTNFYLKNDRLKPRIISIKKKSTQRSCFEFSKYVTAKS